MLFVKSALQRPLILILSLLLILFYLFIAARVEINHNEQIITFYIKT